MKGNTIEVTIYINLFSKDNIFLRVKDKVQTNGELLNKGLNPSYYVRIGII